MSKAIDSGSTYYSQDRWSHNSAVINQSIHSGWNDFKGNSDHQHLDLFRQIKAHLLFPTSVHAQALIARLLPFSSLLLCPCFRPADMQSLAMSCSAGTPPSVQGSQFPCTLIGSEAHLFDADDKERKVPREQSKRCLDKSVWISSILCHEVQQLSEAFLQNLTLTAQTVGCGDTSAFHQICFSRSFCQDLLTDSAIFPTSLTAKCSCRLQELRDLRVNRLIWGRWKSHF